MTRPLSAGEANAAPSLQRRLEEQVLGASSALLPMSATLALAGSAKVMSTLWRQRHGTGDDGRVHGRADESTRPARRHGGGAGCRLNAGRQQLIADGSLRLVAASPWCRRRPGRRPGPQARAVRTTDGVAVAVRISAPVASLKRTSTED